MSNFQTVCCEEDSRTNSYKAEHRKCNLSSSHFQFVGFEIPEHFPDISTKHPLSRASFVMFFLKHLCCCVLWWHAVRQHCSALLRALADLRAVSESKSQHLSVKVQMSHKASSANADGMQKCATQTGPFWTPARLPREVSMKSILQPPSCFGSGWTPNTPRYMLVLTMRCMWYW